MFNAPFNIGGFGRFFSANWLAKEQKSKFVIFIDDDQLLTSTFVEDCIKAKRKKSFLSFWAFKIKNNSYWDRERIKKLSKTTDYCGTGGAIIDIDLFKQPGVFSCPTKYWFMEDLWLSFYAKHTLGWDLGGLRTSITFRDRDNDIGLSLVDKKQQFYTYLISNSN